MAANEHPIFARLYSRFSGGQFEREAPARRQLLAGLSGRVLEPGPGPGLGFALYPSSVTEVVAVEPEPTMRRNASAAAADAPVPVTVVDGSLDALPFDDGAFDAVNVAMVLCSVDQPRALAEIRRVLRPGGRLVFYEHVVAEGGRHERIQRRVAPVWSRLFGGCRVDRDTLAAIEAAGFEVEHTRRLTVDAPVVLQPAQPHLAGVAVRR